MGLRVSTDPSHVFSTNYFARLLLLLLLAAAGDRLRAGRSHLTAWVVYELVDVRGEACLATVKNKEKC
jgi:hypothetical protein